MVVKSLLPLPHHPQIIVVDDGDLYRKFMDHRRGHFLNIHLDRTIARYADHRFIGKSELRADRRGKTVAHGAEPAASEELIGSVHFVVLRRPHLMLAHIGRHDSVAPKDLAELLYRVLRTDRFGVVLVA